MNFSFYLINAYRIIATVIEQACWIFGIGHIIIKLFAVYNGLLIFAKYSSEKCDPVYNGVVEKYDQIFPVNIILNNSNIFHEKITFTQYYVMDIARNIPGLPGLFIVGALSAALSSMSSCLNALSGTMYEDFLKPYLPNASDKQASTIMKFTTFTIGILISSRLQSADMKSFSIFILISVGCVCFAMVFIVEKLGGVFSIGIAFSGITSGTLLGLFTMGMISEKFNTKGALVGSIVSTFVVSVIAIGAQVSIFNGEIKYETLPFNVEGCENPLKTFNGGNLLT